MDVSWAFRAVVAALCVSALTVFPSSQSAACSYNPPAWQALAKLCEGFIDFTPKRPNPADQEHGKCPDDGRVRLLHESLKNGYFWSNLVVLGLLGCLFAIVVYRHKIQRRLDWKTAATLGQYEYALSGLTTQIEQVTKENRRLTENLAALREAALRPAPPALDSPDQPAPAAIKTRAIAAQAGTQTTKSVSVAATAECEVGIATVVRAQEDRVAQFKPDPALVMRVNTLEQQLSHSEEQRKELSRQLNEVGRKLRAEKEKTAALKGG
jgi:chaperonin cofactor prefoldin